MDISLTCYTQAVSICIDVMNINFFYVNVDNCIITASTYKVDLDNALQPVRYGFIMVNDVVVVDQFRIYPLVSDIILSCFFSLVPLLKIILPFSHYLETMSSPFICY